MKAVVKTVKKHFVLKEEVREKEGGLKLTTKTRFFYLVFALGLTVFCTPSSVLQK